MSGEHQAFEHDVAGRLRGCLHTARMWGSPEELEAVAQHFSHVLLASRTPSWTFEATQALWQDVGAPLAQDPEEHARVRRLLWGDQAEAARAQVVSGFACVWAALARRADRERHFTPLIESLLDAPARVAHPDVLDGVLFALTGFVAADPARYVERLADERRRIGGHGLRPLHVVAPPGAVEASLTWTRSFDSWGRVVKGVEAFLFRLPASA